MNRRQFATVAAAASFSPALFGKSKTPPRIGIIGHTGRGSFGHGLDTVWLKIPEAEIVGVADADAAGLKKELGKLKFDEAVGFTDYRKMLAETKPDFVSVCPRHADQHAEMCLAAIDAGVKGIYIEKPFLRSPAECDEVLAAAKKAGTKIAVAHRNRYHPALPAIEKLIADGKIGKFLEIRARGKGDRRGGAEDLWVLGTHVLNLVEYFGGAAKTCSAVMLQDGKRVTKEDVVPKSAEGLGPLAGNALHARYVLEKGITATFDSIANDDTKSHGFGLILVGSKGQINIQCDKNPLAHFLAGNPFEPTTKPSAWEPIDAGTAEEIAGTQNHVAAVRDLLDAVSEDREPLCNADAGARTVEMVGAVFESHRQGGKAVSLPLGQRENALSLL